MSKTLHEMGWYKADMLTPWDHRNGMWYKRDDYHRAANGVNGSKYRACRHLITSAVVEFGIDHVVTAQSVRSPQAAICATLCEELGLKCTVVVGASKPHTAIKHPSVAIAMAAGADLDTTARLAYNNVIQPYAARLARKLGAWQLPYAISPPAEAGREAVEAFLAVGGEQVRNMPDALETLIIPFGSANTSASILYGLATQGANLKKVVLVGVGPDRTGWMHDRLNQVGVGLSTVGEFPFELEHLTLHQWFANYEDMMPETLDGIQFHRTYEGKVIRYLNQLNSDYWINRNGKTGFWIVGGEFSAY